MRRIMFCLWAFSLVSFTGGGRKDKPTIPTEFANIPWGTFTLGPDTLKITVNSFYISKFEVSNRQYREFFSEASKNMSASEKEKIACDTTAWSREIPAAIPMQQYYFRHPAYDHYPVVNISYEGAAAYCHWLEEKIREKNPQYEIVVRLPSREEWIWAAMGGRSQAMFPWGNYYLRNKKGEPMCNFKKVNDGSIYRNRQTGKPEIAEFKGAGDTKYYTATVKSFTPNDYGLYNMCGNAAEMVMEKGKAAGGSWNDYGGDVHIRAEANYNTSAPTVGFRPVIVVREKK